MSEKKGKAHNLHIDYGWLAIAALVVIAATLAIYADRAFCGYL